MGNVGLPTYVVVIRDKAGTLVIYAGNAAVRTTHVTLLRIPAKFVSRAIYCQNVDCKKQNK